MLTPGRVRASKVATWSNVLWSSLRTITRQLSPSPDPGPPVRGSSTVSDISRSVPGRSSSDTAGGRGTAVGRRGLEDRVGGAARALARARRVGLDEALLVVLLRERRLGVEALADAVELRGRIVDPAEVGEAQRLGLPARDRVERGLPPLDVDVRGGRGRQRERLGRDAHAGHVADEGDARRLVQVADVVGGMAGRVLDGEGALEAGLAALEDAQVRLGDGHDLAPQPREPFLAAVEAGGRGDELGRLGQVRGAALVD